MGAGKSVLKGEGSFRDGDEPVHRTESAANRVPSSMISSILNVVTGTPAKLKGSMGSTPQQSVVDDGQKRRSVTDMDWITSSLDHEDASDPKKGGKKKGLMGLVSGLTGSQDEESLNRVHSAGGGGDGGVYNKKTKGGSMLGFLTAKSGAAEGEAQSGGGEKQEREEREEGAEGEDSEEDEEDGIDPAAFRRGGVIKVKPQKDENFVDMEESPPASTLVSPTPSQRNSPRQPPPRTAGRESSAVPEDGGAPEAAGEERQATAGGEQELDSSQAFNERLDLGGPQRYLITLVELVDLAADSGKIYVRGTLAGSRGQESKRHPAGDRLVQGIVKVWTGKIKFQEEFYFEVPDPDTYIHLQVRQTHGSGEDQKDTMIGKEIKILCKTLTHEAKDEYYELGNDLGNLHLICQKVRRTEDVDTEGDEQAVMAALQKHATVADVMLRLSVRVIQAVDIPAMDAGGTSDSYIILTCGANKKRTKVQAKTLHPTWHEDFDFFFPAGTAIPIMDLEMFDRDANLRDDFMGRAHVAVGGLMDWKPRMEWVALFSDSKKPVGKVQIGIVMEPKPPSSESPLNDTIQQWYASEEAMTSFWEGLSGGVGGKAVTTGEAESDEVPPAIIKVTIMRAKDLIAADRGGTSDPYVKVHVADDIVHAKKTAVKDKTLNPTWMEAFELNVMSTHRAQGLWFEVFDKDMIGADDSLGKLMIPIDSLAPDREYRDWYALAPVVDGEVNNGQLELKLMLTEVTDKQGSAQHGAGAPSPNVSAVKGGGGGAKAAIGTAIQGVQVMCVGGRGMPKMDSGMFGKCDPYLKIQIGEQEKKTKTVKRSLAPTWNETFNFDVNPEDKDAELVFTCYDWDMVGEHDLIGSYTVKVKDIKVKSSGWYKLTHPDNAAFNAEIYVTITPLFESAEEAEVRAQKAAEERKLEEMTSVLSITVVAGRGLEAMDSGGTSDPYAVVKVGKEKKKTKVIKKELSPEWNEKFEIVVSNMEEVLNVSVYDKDMIGTDDLIGETMIPLTTIVGQKQSQKWYTLYRESRITGEVLLALKLPRPAGYVAPQEDAVPVDAHQDMSASMDGSLPMEPGAGGWGACCPPPVRVYVSAFMSDMVRERYMLHNKVFPDLRRMCESRGAFCVSVDMRVGMKEEDGEALRCCLDEMKRCSVFICFLGEKYGKPIEDVSSLVAVRPWIESLGGKSLIEIETAAAVVFEPDRFRGRCFIYMRDPAYIDSLPGTTRSDYMEDDPQVHLALEALKKRLKGSDEGVPILDNYADPEAAMAQAAKDLRKCVVAMYPKATRQRLLTIQRHCLLQYAREGVHHYYLDSDLAVRLTNYVAFGDRCVLNIVGPPGSGKTSLLRTWLSIYETHRAPGVFVFPHFDLGASGVESAKGVLRRILFEMRKQFDLKASVPTNYIQIQRTFLMWLRMATAKGKVCIVIDGADGFDEPNDGIGSLLDCVPRVLPKDLRMILSMESGSRAYDSVTKRLSYVKTLSLGALSTQARKSITESMLARLGRKMERIDPRILKHRPLRNPLVLRVTLAHNNLTMRFSPNASMEAMLEEMLERLEGDYHKEAPGVVEKVLTSIARSRRGLTDSELMAIAGINRMLWARLMHECHDLLDGVSTLLNFHHSILDDAVCARYMPTEEKQQKVTIGLANYFEHLTLSFRKAEEYPWLLATNASFWIKSAQPSEFRQVWRRLRDVIGDVDYFLALYTDEYVGDLHDYWDMMEGVYDMVDEYVLSLDNYRAKNAMAGETERILPVWHLARCQSALAAFFVDCGKYEAAVAMYHRALGSWGECQGRAAEASDAQLKLGECLMLWGRMPESEEALKKALAMLEEAYGLEHALCGRAMFLSADVMRRQKKESEAIPFCQRAVEVLDNALSVKHKHSDPLFARTNYTLGVLLEIDERANAAEKSYAAAVALFAKSLGESHPEYCQALEGLAGVYRAQGRLSEAAGAYQQLLPLKEEMSILGGSLGDVTTTQNNLAAVFVQLNDLRAAEVLYRKTVRIREHQYGHSHPTVARSIEMLGNLLSELGDVKDSAFLLQRALNIRERIYGKESIETAATLVNLSTVQCRRGQYHAGRDLFKRWAKIFINALGHSHPTSVWALHWLDRWPEGGPPGTRIGKKKKGDAGPQEDLPGGKLFIHVIRGRGLLAMDSGVSSDPFMVVQFGAHTKKTKVVSKTLSPEWDEKMSFPFKTDDRRNGYVVFQCFDKDVMGDDDDMGRFTINLQDLPVWQAYRAWHTFDDERCTGEVELEIFMSEDKVPQPPVVKPKYDPTGKTVLDQLEERKRRDEERERRRQEQLLQDKEMGFREAARASMNRGSELAIKREERRQAKIAAGLDPDEEDPFMEAELMQSVAEPEDLAAEDAADQEPAEEGQGGGDVIKSRLLDVASDAQQLMQDVADKTDQDEQKATALHLACMTGRQTKVEALLAAGEDVNARDNDGLTPLHYAAGEGQTIIMEILLTAGADLEARDKDGDMPVHIACQENQSDIVLSILKRKPHLLHISGAGHNTLLHTTASSMDDRTDMLVMLLDMGADPRVKNGEGLNALQLAEAVEDDEPDHPHLAIIQKAMGIEKAFQAVVKGAQLRRATADKIHYAIQKRDTKQVTKMLQGGMDVNGQMDDEGLTPLMFAITLLRAEIVSMLASNEWGNPWGLDVSQVNNKHLSPLHFLALTGSDSIEAMHILEVLLTHNPNPNLPDNKRYTPLHYACEKGVLPLVEALLTRAGADLQLKTEDQRHALHVAAFHHQIPVVMYLMTVLKGTAAGNFTFVSTEAAVRDYVNLSDASGSTPMHYLSVNDEHLEAVEALLEAKANPIQVNKEGKSALDIAQEKSQAVLMDTLARAADQMADLQSAELSKRMLLLSYAVKDNDVERLRGAIERGGVDVGGAVDEIGDTLLHTAASSGHVDCLLELIKAGGYVYCTNNFGCTPLHAAAMAGQIDAIRFLLKHEADVRASDSEGYLPMHFAAGEGMLEALKVLIEEGYCDPGLKTFQGLTALHVALSENRIDCVKYLLKYKPQLAVIPDADGALPVTYARSFMGGENENIYKMLAAASTGSRLLVTVSNDTPFF